MEIKRDLYLEKLVHKMDNGSIKVITGVRRCGKSYILNTIFYNYLKENGFDEDHIIKFSFDAADDLMKIGENLIELEAKKQKASYVKFMNYIASRIADSKKYVFLLDEIQKLECFESVLLSYLKKDNVDIYVTGSNSRFLSKDVITEFRGRGDEIHIFPLSFSEYCAFLNENSEQQLEKYMFFGGLPRVVLAKTDEDKMDYLRTQMQHTYLKDIVDRYELHKDNCIEELLSIIASGISGLTNPLKISNTFNAIKKMKISSELINKYISHFEDAFILNKAKRYDVKGKKYISTPYKIYFEDIGFRNVILDFRQVEYTHIMENIIYNELRYRGYNIDVGNVEIREKNSENKEIKKNLEVDFIANKGSKRYYIQSAYDIPNEEKWIQETKSFDNIKDSFKKIIIVNKKIVPHYTEKGYFILGLSEFLLNINSLEL
ncbi:MAG: ATP-binding protein [Alphaproteobacteria bacterium]|nr:ATP-binding protein [Alphaproteobacteria bacterium]